MASNNTFQGTPDIHKGITIQSQQEPCTLEEFPNRLNASLAKWEEEKVRGVWFQVALKDAGWIPFLAERGFRAHHANGGEVMLVRWLPKEVESRIPHFAHTMIGGGAVVLTEDKRVLVVQERFRNIPYWKLPGGYIEPGEEIVAGVQREVLEETNVKTEFVSVVSFRHTMVSNFGCSDIYFVVELKPLNLDLIKEDDEIDAIQWMPVEEYLNHPMVHENNRLFVRVCLGYHEDKIEITRTTTFHPITKKAQALFAAKKTS